MTKGSSKTAEDATWAWDAEAERLSMRAPKGGLYRDLNGDWSLSGVGVLLEGFSRGRLVKALEKGDGRVSCALTLSNGRQIRLIGAFSETGRANGRLVGDAMAAGEAARPGPALEPAFQPIISLKDGRVVGFEALARWSGNGSDTGSSERLEDDALAANMLIQAAEALSDWQKVSPRRDIFVHVNLTGRDLARGDAPGLIEALVHGHRLEPGMLKIELTEQAALRDAASALAAVKALKAAGAGLVLDDFGSGHSSFAWLADMPADGLKIDSDLTRRLGDARTDTILEAVNLLARRLKMTVTAEGVESRSDSAKLRALGFDYAQGFAFARPMVASDALTFLKDQA